MAELGKSSNDHFSQYLSIQLAKIHNSVKFSNSFKFFIWSEFGSKSRKSFSLAFWQNDTNANVGDLMRFSWNIVSRACNHQFLNLGWSWLDKFCFWQLGWSLLGAQAYVILCSKCSLALTFFVFYLLFLIITFFKNSIIF